MLRCIIDYRKINYIDKDLIRGINQCDYQEKTIFNFNSVIYNIIKFLYLLTTLAFRNASFLIYFSYFLQWIELLIYLIY